MYDPDILNFTEIICSKIKPLDLQRLRDEIKLVSNDKIDIIETLSDPKYKKQWEADELKIILCRVVKPFKQCCPDTL